MWPEIEQVFLLKSNSQCTFYQSSTVCTLVQNAGYVLTLPGQCGSCWRALLQYYWLRSLCCTFHFPYLFSVKFLNIGFHLVYGLDFSLQALLAWKTLFLSVFFLWFPTIAVLRFVPIQPVESPGLWLALWGSCPTVMLGLSLSMTFLEAKWRGQGLPAF